MRPFQSIPPSLAFVAAVLTVASCRGPGGGVDGGEPETAAVEPGGEDSGEPTGEDRSNRAAVDPGGRWGYIDDDGDVVIDPVYLAAGPFCDGLAAVSLDRRWGFIDPDGKAVIEPQYSGADTFSDGRAAVAIGEHFGYVDPRGRLVVADRLGGAGSFAGGLAPAADTRGRWGFIDEAGNEVLVFQFDDARPFAEDRAAVKLEPGWGYVDRDGRIVIGPEHVTATSFSEGLAGVCTSEVAGSCGYRDPTGAWAIGPGFDEVMPFSQGNAAVRKGGGWSFVKHDGEAAFEGRFDEARPLSDGLAYVRQGDRVGYIDATGTWVIEAAIDEGRDFSDGWAAVRVGERWGFIDRTGTFVAEPRYADVGAHGGGRAPVLLRYDVPFVGRDGRERFIADPDGARVDVIDVDVRGFRSPERVEQYVQRRRSQMRVCYRQQLAADAGLSGEMTLVMASKPGRQSRDITVEDSTVDSDELEQCATLALRHGQPGPGAAGADGGVATVRLSFSYEAPTTPLATP